MSQREFDRVAALARDHDVSQADLDRASDGLKSARDNRTVRQVQAEVNEREVTAAQVAVAVAQRTKPSGRAELALTTCILWNALIGCPIYALGLTGHLTARALGTLSAAFFALGLIPKPIRISDAARRPGT